jgi:hypothetical protein
MILSPGQEKRLDWFFGAAQTLFTRSTQGAALERAFNLLVPRLPDPELIRARFDREPHEPPPGQITARPGSSKHSPASYSPDEGLMEMWGELAEVYRIVVRADATSACVLGAYYGNEGARWGRTVHTRLFAVFPLTEAGAELLRRSRKRARGAELELSASEELADEFEVQRIQPMPARGMLADQARAQALRAYERACRLWVSALREVDK